MFLRRKYDPVYHDSTTDALMNQGVYSVQGPDMKEKKIGFFSKEHNILTGMWYVFILSILLWWLPVFGQMIAGYLGGRKAGSPAKGVLVAVIPVFIIVLILVAFDMGMLPFLGAIAGIPGWFMGGVKSISPHAASYVAGIYSSLMPLVGLNGNGFFIVVVFGLIGGMMADMNKKEILRATGNTHFYDDFLGRFSGASLSKLADMVAERVIWTLGTIDHGSRSLLPTRHREPTPLGFEELQRLPSTTSSYSSLSQWNEPVSYQPERAFGYDEPPRDDGYIHRENPDFEEAPLISWDRREDSRYYDDDWDINHYDLTEDSMTDTWIDHKRSTNKKKPKKRSGRSSNNRSKKLSDYKKVSSSKVKTKRDAVVYDGKGNLMDEGEEKKRPKSKRTPSKKKQPSIVTRALATDKALKEAESEPEPELSILEVKEEKETKKGKASQSYERL
ncbi:MAG: hypothetical protein JSV56_03550 [Methanomassiliicoccales archaeon]|nr:MAG: hypothetical protein JSV56_03550 [Methanomassiliicoccales archaeon]